MQIAKLSLSSLLKYSVSLTEIEKEIFILEYFLRLRFRLLSRHNLLVSLHDKIFRNVLQFNPKIHIFMMKKILMYIIDCILPSVVKRQILCILCYIDVQKPKQAKHVVKLKKEYINAIWNV